MFFICFSKRKKNKATLSLINVGGNIPLLLLQKQQGFFYDSDVIKPVPVFSYNTKIMVIRGVASHNNVTL